MIATLVKGDLVVTNAARINLHRWNSIDAIRLSQIAALPDVARVIPVYEGHVGLKSPDDARVRRIIVYAVPPDDMPLAIGNSDAVARNLKFTHGFMYDRLSRPIFGDIQRASKSRSTNFPCASPARFPSGPTSSMTAPS